MPNANPAGVNQPLDQAPRTAYRAHIIGADASLFTDIPVAASPGADTLIVSGPAAGGVRQVSTVFEPLSVFINGAGLELDSIAFVLKKVGGGESIITTDTTITDGDSFLLTGLPLFLKDDVIGVFLRIIDAGGAVPGVSGYASWQDVRNVDQQNTEMPDAAGTRIEVLSGPGVGNTRQVTAEGVFPVPVWCHNYDDVSHNVSMFLSNGLVDIPVGDGSAAVVVAAGTSALLVIFSVGLTPGWSLKAEMTANVSTQTPVISVAYTDTNQAPVLPDQASAF